MDRRKFLKATGVSLALPMLESIGKEKQKVSFSSDAPAKRLVCVGSNLGFHREAFYPKGKGRNYKTSTLLSHIDGHRQDFTVFSGLDHRAGNGHHNWDNFLCGDRVGTISLDQVVAEQVGDSTRIPSMQLCAGGIPSIQKLSYNRQGVPLPMTDRPSVVYKKLFSSASDRARSSYLLRSGQSSIDTVLDQAKTLQRKVSTSDKQRLSEYFNSVREVEKRMIRQLEYLKKDPITTNYKLPSYDPVAPSLMLEAESIMYDLTALALQTESTKVVSMFLAGLGQVFTLNGVTLQAGYHALSHHGKDPEMIRDLVKIESEHMKCLNRFLGQLKEKKDKDGRALLDSTIVLLGTGMGNASTHSNTDCPTLVAGGGFKHGKHIWTDRYGNKNAHILGDLYVTLLNQLGVEADTFANATRKMEV